MKSPNRRAFNVSFLRGAAIGAGLLALALLPARAVAQTLYETDAGGKIYSISPGGVVSTFASGFSFIQGLTVNGTGELFVANYGNGTVLKVTPDGIASTFVSFLGSTEGVVFNSADTLYVSSLSEGIIYAVTPGGGVSTDSDSGYSSALAINGTGTLFSGSYSGAVYEVTPTGSWIPFVLGFDGPYGLAFNSAGNLFVSNFGNGTISEVTPGGSVSTFASGFSGPEGLAFDGAGNLFVANVNNGTISKVTPGGVVSTFVPASAGLSPQYLAFGPVPVPEPADAAATLGLAALAACRWSRSRKKRC